VTRIALASVEGFALAGSGAIREHGVIDRPTEDVDLFTANADEDAFNLAVDHVTAQLRSSGCEVELTRRAEHFARLHVVTGEGAQLDVDLGVDWRQDEPVGLAVGPVLSLDDAVGSKIGALYSRGEVRDYLDVDAIRSSGRFNDEQLLTAAADRDPGFRLDMFLWRLDGARRITPDDVERYGVTAAQLAALQSRYDRLATELRAEAAQGSSGAGVAVESPPTHVDQERKASPARTEPDATVQPSGTRPPPTSAILPARPPRSPGRGPTR
jgi:hypothetical protein